MNGFCGLLCIKVVYNNKQIVGSWNEIDMYYSFRNFYIQLGYVMLLNFWRRNDFFLILAHPVYKMWIIQEPNTLEL